MGTGLLLAVAFSATTAPPGHDVVNHAHPGHFAQPTLRVFERAREDRDRRSAWMAYCRELDGLWADYRAAGSTPSAFRRYLAAAGEARRRYVYNDPHFAPILP